LPIARRLGPNKKDHNGDMVTASHLLVREPGLRGKNGSAVRQSSSNPVFPFIPDDFA